MILHKPPVWLSSTVEKLTKNWDTRMLVNEKQGRETIRFVLVLWPPTHGHLSRGRPATSFWDTLMRDTDAADVNALSVCMAKSRPCNSLEPICITSVRLHDVDAPLADDRS